MPALEIIELSTEPTDDPDSGFIYRWADSTTGKPKAKNSAGTVFDFVGPAGPQGLQGIQGNDGNDGATGPAGPSFVVGYAFKNTQQLNNTSSNDSYLQANINIPSAGDYEIHFSWSWSLNDSAQDCIVDAIVDGTTYKLQQEEPKDTGGPGASGTNQRLPRSADIVHNFASSGSKSIDIQFRGSQNGDNAALYRGYFRVGNLS